MASRNKLFLFWILLLNAIWLSASRSLHHRSASRKAAVGQASKKQTMFIPGVVGGAYGQYPGTTAQSASQGCCSSYGYPPQYPYMAPTPAATPQPSCCDSSNPHPPSCCINLKLGQSKKLKLNAAGMNYLLTVNLGGGNESGSGNGSIQSKDASATKAPPTDSIPTDAGSSGSTSSPASTSGGSSTGSTVAPTTSPTTGLPVNVNQSSSSGPTAPPPSPGSTGGSSDNGSDNITNTIDKIIGTQGGQGQKNRTNPNGKSKDQRMKQNKQGQVVGEVQHENHGQGHHGQENSGIGQQSQKQGEGQSQGQGQNSQNQGHGALTNKDKSNKQMKIFVDTPLEEFPLQQRQDKGKGHRNGKGNDINKHEDACMEGPSMCGQQQVATPPVVQISSPLCSPLAQTMNPCPPAQSASMPCMPQQGNPCQQSAPSIPCPPSQVNPCVAQVQNPCAQALPAPCPLQQSIDPCVQVSSGPCGPGGETGGGTGTGGDGSGAGTGAGAGGGGGSGGVAGTTGGGGVQPPNKACVQEVLQLHNSLRAKHGSPPLKLNTGMSQGAQAYAKQLAAAGGELQHSAKNQRVNQGENLARTCSNPAKPADCKAMTQRWYDEVRNYNWNKSGSSQLKEVGHFTQLVWKSSTELGVGLAQFVNKEKMTCHILVARYRPRGNVPGMYNANVVRGSP